MTPLILSGKEEKRWSGADQGSVFLGEVRREKLAGEGEVFFLLLLSHPLCAVFVA